MRSKKQSSICRFCIWSPLEWWKVLVKRKENLIFFGSILPIWFSGCWLFLINISGCGPRPQRSDLLIPQSSQQTHNHITNQGVDLYSMAKPIFSNFHMEYPITGREFQIMLLSKIYECFKLCSHQQGTVYQFAWFLLEAQIIYQDRSVQFDWQ